MSNSICVCYRLATGDDTPFCVVVVVNLGLG